MRFVDDAEVAVLAAAKDMLRRGLVEGTAGNISARREDGTIVITPSSVDYRDMTIDDLVVVHADGAVVRAAEGRNPSSEMALHLAPRLIRINAMHPSNCNTHLLHNDGLYGLFRPDLEHPTKEDAELAFTFFQAMPIPYVEPEDVANLALFLASDESRFITGQQIGIDGGALIKARRGAGL